MEALQTAFLAVSTSDTAQGITKDSTYYYFTTHNNIYKIPIAGGTVVSRTTSSDGDTNVKHQNDLCVDASYLYVATNNYDVAPTTPKSYIKVFNKSDLTYVTQYEVSTTKRISWVIKFSDHFLLGGGMDSTIYKWNLDLDTLIDTVVVKNIVYSGHGWNGGVFDGTNLILNIHDGSTPSIMQVFEYDEANFEFTYKETMQRPLSCGQGIHYEDGNLYLARRAYGSDPEHIYGTLAVGIVTSEIVPYDGRMENIDIRSLDAEQTISGTTYTEITGTGAEIYAKQHDIIEVTHQCIGYVTASTCDLRLKIMPKSGEADVYELYPDKWASMRTSKTNVEGETLTMTKYYRAQADQIHKFNVQAKETGTGTGKTSNHITTVKVIGKANY